MGYFAPTYLPPHYKAKTLEPENDGSQNEWYHITYSNGSDSCFALNASDGGYGAGDDDKIAYKSISSNNLGVNFTLDYLKKSKNQWGSMLPDRCFYPPESIANKNSEVSTCVDITQSRADIECKKTISRSEAIKVLKSLRYFRGAVKLRACDRTGDNQLSCLP